MKKHRIRISQFTIRNCEFQESPAFNAVVELLESREPPTALFSFNSLMTIGAIKAIASCRRSIPKDISLIGYDEIPGHAIFKPTMTYIQQPIEELGKNATEILLQKIAHPHRRKKQNVFLAPRLIIGNSCKRIRANGE